MNEENTKVHVDSQSTNDFQKQVAEDLANVAYHQERRFTGTTTQQVLRELFNNIQVDLGLTPMRWEKIIAKFIENDKSGKTPTELRSSIKKNFLRSAIMTLIMFVRALRLLPLLRVRLGVTLVFANRKVTDHGIWFNVNKLEDVEGQDDTIGDVTGPVKIIQRMTQDDRANTNITSGTRDELASKLTKIANSADTGDQF